MVERLLKNSTGPAKKANLGYGERVKRKSAVFGPVALEKPDRMGIPLTLGSR